MRFSHLPALHTMREHQPIVLQSAAHVWPAVHLPIFMDFFAAAEAASGASASDKHAKAANKVIFMSFSQRMNPRSDYSNVRRESGNMIGMNLHS